MAWHVLRSVATEFGLELPERPEDPLLEVKPGLTLSFGLQLMPEAAEIIAQYERVCFIDAHTGRVENLVNLEKIQPKYVNSPFTHHLTPHTCLSIAATLYGKAPEAVLVSIRGFEFGFSQELSEQTQALVPAARQAILDWIASRPGEG